MKSLRSRLFISFTALLAAAMMMFGVIVWLVAREAMTNDVDDFLRSKAMLLGRVVTPMRNRIEPWIEQELQVQERHFMLQVFAADGSIAGKSSNLAHAIPLSDEARRSEHPAGNAVIETLHADGRVFRVATHPRRDLWGDPVVLYAQALMPLDTVQARERRLLAWLVSCGVAMLAAGAVASWFMSRQWLRSVSNLEEAARGLSSAELGLRRLFVPADDAELAALAASFNLLLDRLESAHMTQQRFTADASHELRTPIAAIRTQVQVAMGATHITERQHALAQVLEGCDRAAHLMDQLLTLSRLEASGELSTAVVDWSQLAQEVAAGLAPKAIAKNQTLELEAEQPCPVRGNAVLLGVLIRNLLDNAIRYSPPSAEIRVRVARNGNRVELEVEDSGIGLSDADLARLGERFFRVLGNAESGSGLGWSIVQRIARIHQMEVQVQRSQKLGGLWVRVEGGDN